MLTKSSANNAKTILSYCKLWHFVDARSEPLGRLTSRLAILLMGKHKPIFHPVADCGDYVVVRNAQDLILSGRKMEQKEYIRHTGYPGGLRRAPVSKLLETDPAQIVLRAVKGMLPKNKLRQVRLERLKVFAGAETPYDSNHHIDYTKAINLDSNTTQQ